MVLAFGTSKLMAIWSHTAYISSATHGLVLFPSEAVEPEWGGNILLPGTRQRQEDGNS